MNLYRLDIIDTNGAKVRPVPDRIMGGDYLARARRSADTRAAEISEAPEGCADHALMREGAGVLVTRISGGGHMRPVAKFVNGNQHNV